MTNTMKLTEEQCSVAFNAAPLEQRRWIVLILDELERARKKHPIMGADIVHAAAIVGEEAGELQRAALQVAYEGGRYYDMHKEAVQVGAMALRFLLEGAPELPYPANKKHAASVRMERLRIHLSMAGQKPTRTAKGRR